MSALEKIFEFITELNDRAQWVIKYRLGLFGETEMTWDPIGILFNISRERVRQIFIKALVY